MDYVFKSPHLAPGKYLLTVYAYSGREVLCWVENIDACFITADAGLGPGMLVSSLRGVVVPPFDVSLSPRVDRPIK